ncbi:MAG: DUF4153 domain-containing protein [Gemmatimonadaceae bacterium]
MIAIEGRRRLILLWVFAVSLAWLGAELGFETLPGINWGIWTVLASVGLLVALRLTGRTPSTELHVTLGLACVLACGAAFTTNEGFHVLIVLSVMLLMGMAALLATDPSPERVDAGVILWSPLIAAANCAAESFRRGSEAIEVLVAERSRPVVRGLAISLPVVGVLALILSQADPTLELWRDTLLRTLMEWLDLPRIGFFVVILVATLGAYGLVMRGKAVGIPRLDAGEVFFRVGTTERLMVFGGVAGLFALFLILQLSYLFGNVPMVTGNGISFAEYAHRGFAELSVVATLCTLLVLASDRYALRGTVAREGAVRMLQLAVIVETQFLLLSAFRRLAIYEAAYGFTAARLYAQVYLIVVSVVLTMLGWEIWRTVDARRLVRRSAATAALALIGLTYWNHEAWIAEQNLERYKRTGKLDSSYLASLSPNALPTILAAVQNLPPAYAREPLAMLHRVYGSKTTPERQRHWHEWNLRYSQATEARDEGLGTLGIRD